MEVLWSDDMAREPSVVGRITAVDDDVQTYMRLHASMHSRALAVEEMVPRMHLEDPEPRESNVYEHYGGCVHR